MKRVRRSGGIACLVVVKPVLGIWVRQRPGTAARNTGVQNKVRPAGGVPRVVSEDPIKGPVADQAVYNRIPNIRPISASFAEGQIPNSAKRDGLGLS